MAPQAPLAAQARDVSAGPGTFDRATAIERLRTEGAGEGFDVLVVGGGITGVGVALDAASRGLRTALVERDDFASGTSSKSSKLIHGGIRYLQQGDVRLVYEALAERQRLLRNAPHLVHELPFLLPILTRDGLINRKLARALGSAMWMYDLTGGARIGKLHKKISAEEALEFFPTLPAGTLAGGYIYYDCEADDARLTLAIARTAALDHGAIVLNRASLVGVDPAGDGTSLAELRLGEPGRPDEPELVTVRTRTVVNATGVWADEVTSLQTRTDSHTIRPAKGIHITVPWEKVRNTIAAVVPVRGDKRSVFVVPWGKSTYIGTTDTDYQGPVDDPQCTPEDIDYLLDAMNRSTDVELTRDDITGTWAGLRPLVDDGHTTGRTADLSRRHRVKVEEGGEAGEPGAPMVTITGGKLTTYREMAADTVDELIKLLEEQGETETGATGSTWTPWFLRRSNTKKMPIRGGEGLDDAAAAVAAHPAIDDELAEHLIGRYGTETTVLVAMIEDDPTLAELLDPRLHTRAVEIVYGARYEMAQDLDDLLGRRTRSRLRNVDATLDIASRVAELAGDELGWDAERRALEVAVFRASVEHELRSGGLEAGPAAPIDTTVTP